MLFIIVHHNAVFLEYQRKYSVPVTKQKIYNINGVYSEV